MKHTNSKLILGVSVAFLLATNAPTMVLASDPAGEDLSPDQIFKQTQETYASMTSYSDEGKVVTTLNGDTITTIFTIRLARVTFYRIEWTRNSAPPSPTMNTSPQAVWSSGAGDYLETGLGAQNKINANFALAEGSGCSGGAAGTVPRVFFNLRWDDELDTWVFSGKRQTDENVAGVDCYVFIKEAQGQAKTLWIGKQDFLIRQVRTVRSIEGMQSISIETHTNIVLNKKFVRSDFIPFLPTSQSTVEFRRLVADLRDQSIKSDSPARRAREWPALCGRDSAHRLMRGETNSRPQG